MSNQLYALWHDQFIRMDSATDFELAHIHLNELGQVAGQTLHIKFGEEVVWLAATGFHTRTRVSIHEVQRHLDVNHLALDDALEVDVQHLLLVGVPLRIAQQDRLLGAIDIQRQHGGVKRFLAQRVIQRVVVQFDLHRAGFTTVNDTGDFTGVTQTAARTRTLQITLGSNNFDFHVASPKKPA